MNEFDQYVKRELLIKNYVRYADDFIIVSDGEKKLKELLSSIGYFLKTKLRLEFLPKKVSVRKYSQGIDFLGYVILPHYSVVRTKTKQRIFRRLRRRVTEFKQGIVDEQCVDQSLQPYRGVLSHANCYRVRQEMENQTWFLKPNNSSGEFSAKGELNYNSPAFRAFVRMPRNAEKLEIVEKARPAGGG